MIWVACIVLVFLAAIYVLTPLFRKPKTAGSRQSAVGSEDWATETELDRLLDQKTVIYGNLRDLEFEYKMGRLSDTDFQQLGAGYKNEAAGILQKLDNLSAPGKLKKDKAARKAGQSASGSKPVQEAPLCPSCGAEVIAGKKYCADCGHKLL